MPYAVTLDLDQAAVDRALAMAVRIERAGIGGATVTARGVRPHLTLAVYGDLDAGAVSSRLAAFARAEPRMPLAIPALGAFPAIGAGAVYLAPTPTVALLDLQARLHAALPDLAEACHRHCRPGQWVPHVTLAMDLPAGDLAPALAAAAQDWSPLQARATGLGFLSFHPVRVVGRWPLAG